MITKKDLRDYRHYAANMQHLSDMIHTLDSQMKSITSILDPNKVGSGTKPPDEWVVKFDEIHKLQKQYSISLQKSSKLAMRIERALERCLDEREKRLMRLRYFRNCKWELICVELNYEWAHVHRLHSTALKKLEQGRG